MEITIKAIIVKAIIGTIQELMSLVNVLVMPLVAMTNLMWRRSLINKNLPPQMIKKTRPPFPLFRSVVTTIHTWLQLF